MAGTDCAECERQRDRMVRMGEAYCRWTGSADHRFTTTYDAYLAAKEGYDAHRATHRGAK